MQLLNNIYLFELGVVTRKFDLVACKQQKRVPACASAHPD